MSVSVECSERVLRVWRERARYRSGVPVVCVVVE